MALARAQAAVSAALPRVVVGAASDRDAAGQRQRIDPGTMRQFGQFGAAADTGQQQPVGSVLGQQAQRGLDPLRPAGEGHDPVGVRRRVDRPVRLVHEPGEAGRRRPAQRPVTATPIPTITQPAQQPSHGRRRSQRRTVAWAVRKPIAAAAAGRPGSVSHSAGGSAATTSPGDIASATAAGERRGEARQGQQHRQGQ